MTEGTTFQDLKGGRSGSQVPETDLSALNAFPYFVSISIFPLVAAAAFYGGWWLAGPVVFLWLADQFDTALGTDESNIDPHQDTSQLFWYNLAVWSWVAIYPAVFLFAFWQIFHAEHLALWETVLIVLALGGMARLTLNTGHDMMHRRSQFERRCGEVLMASVSFPQEITEHVFVHHAHIGTPRDAVSPPKGMSFWAYLPRSVLRSYRDTWIVERDRLARRRRSPWHYSNPVWRYIGATAAWYLLAFLIGGGAGILVFAAICAMGIFQLRMVDYIQHYGLQRIRTPEGRYERVLPRHSWSVAYKLPNWFYYNAQRHADHHMTASRLYPLLQHAGPEQAPQLPGSYSVMGNLILSPKHWFRKMDPLVDEWRQKFYPQIEDWSAYDSAAYRACPEAYPAIDQIHRMAPALVPWINREPRLLDGLQNREFADLDLPDGFGPDPEFETIARRGLARVYWTLELDVTEMRSRIADMPVRSTRDAIDAARTWSNDKIIQLCIHVLRGNLSPMEAGVATANIAVATVDAAISAVCNYTAGSRARDSFGIVLFGDVASGDALIGADLRALILTEDSPVKSQDRFFGRVAHALQDLSQDNLLFQPVSPSKDFLRVRSLAEYVDLVKADRSGSQVMDLLQARSVFALVRHGLDERLVGIRREICIQGAARDQILVTLGEPPATAGLEVVKNAARILQLVNAEAVPEIISPDVRTVFRTAAARSLISTDVAGRLVEAASLQKTIIGISQLTENQGREIIDWSTNAKSLLAQTCGVEDTDAVITRIQATEEQIASDLREIAS